MPSKILAPVTIVLFNAVPLLGVLQWGWRSFDIIYLYWMENIIIGLFTVLRLTVRRYSGAYDIKGTAFLVPFFIVHYGLFCTVHGLFVVNMFGNEALDNNGLFTAYAAAPQLMTSDYLWFAALAFCGLHLFEWLQDSFERGWGPDDIRKTMMSPYRRIMVLHVTIFASGFALGAMSEPLAGLVLLVAVKTGFDLHHLKMHEKAGSHHPTTSTE